MNVNKIPFNIKLLTPDDNDVKNIKPVKNLSIFVGNTKNFHPDGLYSTDIFGKVGETKRNELFSYIEVYVPIFHPLVFKAIGDLKQFYLDILSSKKYAVYNEEINDFVETTIEEGNTGFEFFMQHFKTLDFERRASTRRNTTIDMLNKYRDDSIMSKIVVMPAGLRDYIIDETGKPVEDEINTFYRRILSISNNLSDIDVGANIEYVDSIRFNLQTAVLELYNYIKSLLEGKKKLILGKWASRTMFNSTRNVLTSYIPKATSLDAANSPSTEQTVIGVHQYIRSILPLAVSKLKDGYLGAAFPGPNIPAVLINKKTLKSERVDVSSDTYDSWMSYDGIEKIASRFGIADLRHQSVEIEGHYLALIYRGPDNTYKVFNDIGELPEDFNKENVSPLTMGELLYLSVCHDAEETPLFITRYPLINFGGIYPSYTYLKSTIKSEIRTKLDHNWKPTLEIAPEFPTKDSEYFSSVSVAVKHLGRLGADYDGDTVSVTAVLSENAKLEVKKKMHDRSYYVDVNNKMFFNSSSDITDLVLASMTG